MLCDGTYEQLLGDLGGRIRLFTILSLALLVLSRCSLIDIATHFRGEVLKDKPFVIIQEAG